MHDEDLLLNAYIDGELPEDIVRELEARIAADSSLRARLARWQAVSLSSAPVFEETAASVRVWNRLEWSMQGSRGRHPIHRLKDFLRGRINLPVPAFAAMALVVGVLGGFALLRDQGSAPAEGVATLPVMAPEPVSYPALADADTPRGLPVAEGGDVLVNSGGDILNGGSGNQGLAVTFEVDNLEELLQILEGRSRIQELKIRLPKLQDYPSQGEPLLLDASGMPAGEGTAP